MATWDVFHSEKMEVERAVSTAAVRAALARGAMRGDDLVRPTGTSVPWTRIAEVPALVAPEPAPPPAPPRGPAGRGPTPFEPDDEPPVLQADDEPPVLQADDEPPTFLPDDDEPPVDEPDTAEALPPISAPAAADFAGLAAGEAVAPPPRPLQPGPQAAEPPRFDDVRPATTEDLDPRPLRDEPGDYGRYDLDLDPDRRVNLPVEDQVELAWDAEDDEYDPQAEDEEAAEFTFTRNAAEKVEELDLAAMVDVAFQMVLFFLVTASTIVYKTLEVPKPREEAPPGAVAQAPKRTLEDLENDFIVVAVDPTGNITIDKEPAAPDELVARLRSARQQTGRTTMLLTADFHTPHRNAVLALDAANEIGLGIAMARPTDSGAPPPPPGLRGGG